jgi:choline dehydrogenase-like flavoprotein
MAHDVTIIGSGPAGVSAAWPLVRAGLKVLMLDQGRKADVPRSLQGTFRTILQNREDQQWREFLGDDFAGVGDERHTTPKMKVPQFRYVQRGFEDVYSLSANGLRPTGSLAAGGLSNMWGAGAFCYNDDDLSAFPVNVGDLMPSYRAVAERIGISGVLEDDIAPFLGDVPLQDPLPLCENAQRLLERYNQRRHVVNKLEFVMGRTRNAVITKDQPDRQACALDNMCLWGCSRGAIYSAAQELESLSQLPNFTFQRGAFVQRIVPQADHSYHIECKDVDDDASTGFIVKSERICLAAGTIGSTILAMDALNILDAPMPILSHPAMAFAFVLPGRIGRPEADKAFALGQLAYRLGEPLTPEHHAFGILFSAEGLLASELATYMPLSRPAAAKTIKALLPAMILANCYVPGIYSNSSIKISRKSVDRRAVLQGGVSHLFEARFNDIKKTLARAMWKMGAYMIPGGAKLAELGSDGHYAGSIPMTKEDRPLTSTPEGEIRGLPNIHTVDGAALTQLSGKHPTFTIMANADRISHRMARRLREI